MNFPPVITLRTLGGLSLLLLLGHVPVAPAAAAAENEQVAGLLFLVAALVLMAMAFPVSALTMLYAAIAPSVTVRATGQIAVRRRVGFWLGLGILGVGLVLFTGFQSLAAAGSGLFGLVNLVLAILLTLAWLVGFSGVAHYVGRTILTGKEVSTPLATGFGALTLSLCACLPIVGWIIGFYVTCLSLGIFPYAWFGAPAPLEEPDLPPLRADDIDIIRTR